MAGPEQSPKDPNSFGTKYDKWEQMAKDIPDDPTPAERKAAAEKAAGPPDVNNPDGTGRPLKQQVNEQLEKLDDELNLSGDEKKRLVDCFEKPEFRDMFQDYLAEISDPKNRAETDEYLRQCEGGMHEGQVPEGLQLVLPTAGFCIKTKTTTDDAVKTFVNITHSDKVKEAVSVRVPGQVCDAPDPRNTNAKQRPVPARAIRRRGVADRPLAVCVCVFRARTGRSRTAWTTRSPTWTGRSNHAWSTRSASTPTATRCSCGECPCLACLGPMHCVRVFAGHIRGAMGQLAGTAGSRQRAEVLRRLWCCRDARRKEFLVDVALENIELNRQLKLDRSWQEMTKFKCKNAEGKPSVMSIRKEDQNPKAKFGTGNTREADGKGGGVGGTDDATMEKIKAAVNDGGKKKRKAAKKAAVKASKGHESKTVALPKGFLDSGKASKKAAGGKIEELVEPPPPPPEEGLVEPKYSIVHRGQFEMGDHMEGRVSEQAAVVRRYHPESAPAICPPPSAPSRTVDAPVAPSPPPLLPSCCSPSPNHPAHVSSRSPPLLSCPPLSRCVLPPRDVARGMYWSARDANGAVSARLFQVSCRPKELVVKIELPRIRSAREVELDVSTDRLVLTVDDKYNLEIDLPFPIDDAVRTRLLLAPLLPRSCSADPPHRAAPTSLPACTSPR